MVLEGTRSELIRGSSPGAAGEYRLSPVPQHKSLVRVAAMTVRAIKLGPMGTGQLPESFLFSKAQTIVAHSLAFHVGDERLFCSLVIRAAGFRLSVIKATTTTLPASEAGSCDSAPACDMDFCNAGSYDASLLMMQKPTMKNRAIRGLTCDEESRVAGLRLRRGILRCVIPLRCGVRRWCFW